MRPELILWILQAENFENASELHGKQLRFWTHKSKIAPRTFSAKLAGRKLLTCVWISRLTALFLDSYSENCAQNFFCKTCRPKTSNMRLNFTEKQHRFWTHKSCNCAQNIFCVPCTQRNSKIRLNFTTNSFVFWCINRDNASRTFSAKLAGGEVPNCVWNSRKTATFLDA